MRNAPLAAAQRPSNLVGQCSRAQSVVEFAVVLPVLLLMTLGMIDFGRAFTFGVGTQQGAREAARYGSRLSVNPNVSDVTVLQRMIDASNPALQGCSAVQTTQTCGGGSWTFSLAVVPPGSASTYTSIGDALAASQGGSLAGGSVTVTAKGSVAMLGGLCTAGNLCLPNITIQGQSTMEFL